MTDADAIKRLENLRGLALQLPDNHARRILIETFDDVVERLIDPDEVPEGTGPREVT